MQFSAHKHIFVIFLIIVITLYLVFWVYTFFFLASLCPALLSVLRVCIRYVCSSEEGKKATITTISRAHFTGKSRKRTKRKQKKKTKVIKWKWSLLWKWRIGKTIVFFWQNKTKMNKCFFFFFQKNPYTHRKHNNGNSVKILIMHFIWSMNIKHISRYTFAVWKSVRGYCHSIRFAIYI